MTASLARIGRLQAALARMKKAKNRIQCSRNYYRNLAIEHEKKIALQAQIIQKITGSRPD